MLTWEDDVEVHALRKRGWSISAIARHTGRDRKTVRNYLSGERTPGVRARPSPDPFEPFVDYVTARLVEDPHLWARTLFDEFETWVRLSYPSLTRKIRDRKLRPVCEACRTATDRPMRSSRTHREMKPSGTGSSSSASPSVAPARPGGASPPSSDGYTRWPSPAVPVLPCTPRRSTPHKQVSIANVGSPRQLRSLP